MRAQLGIGRAETEHGRRRMARGRRTGGTMSIVNVQQLDRIADYLRRKRRSDVSLSDVVALAEITAESLQTFFSTMDASVYRELREIADYIQSMKQEIGALQANDLKETRIPAAGQELGAIVQATEAATNTIMECAESLMAADTSDPAAYRALVEAKMLIVFEACSFQDITGQRIAKVVETLQHIEERVTRFASAVRTADFEGATTDEERARAERRERLLLHGPQSAGKAIAQNDVDAMFD
jgi:chemotaxis protein CheZ